MRNRTKFTYFLFLFAVLFASIGVRASAEPISEEESAKYRELFQLYSDIELLESKRDRYREELEEIGLQIEVSENRLSDVSLELDQLLADYAEIIKERQLHGEGSAIKLLLGSKSLGDFFYRLRLAETISGAYGRVVANVDDKIAEERSLVDSLVKSREELAEKTTLLEKSISDKKMRAAELEAYLAALGEEREKYEAGLRELSEKWENLKPMFAASVQTFKDLIESGGLPNEVGEVSITLAGVRGIIKEDVFNTMLADALRGKVGVTEMVFDFVEGGINVAIPEHGVKLYGKFEVQKKSLIYVVERGVFSDIEMGQSAIDDLFFGGRLEFDLSSLIGSMELRDCRQYDGYIDIGIKLY